MTSEQTTEVKDIISSYSNIFSANDEDVGFTSHVKHRIELTDVEPFKKRHHLIPLALYHEVKTHLLQLLTVDVIKRSHSPWVFIACGSFRSQKNGDLRMVESEKYALPCIEEILDCLSTFVN